MTKLEALETSARIWKWLAKNPGKSKAEALGALGYSPNGMLNNCPCCQFVVERHQNLRGGLPCSSVREEGSRAAKLIHCCPLNNLWPMGCEDASSPYSNWHMTPMHLPLRRQEFAREIAEFAEEAAMALREELQQLEDEPSTSPSTPGRRGSAAKR